MLDTTLVATCDDLRSNVEQKLKLANVHKVAETSDFPEGQHFQNFEESTSHHWEGFKWLQNQNVLPGSL